MCGPRLSPTKMDLQVIFFLSFYLYPYFVNASVIVINYNEEMEQILADFNISNPTPEQKQFARKIIDERIEKEKYHIEKENHHIEKNELAQNLRKAHEHIGFLRSEKERALNKSLEAFVVPYLCQKTELYLDLWGRDAQSENSTITNSASDSAAAHTPQDPPLKHDLDLQTRSNYRNNAKKILFILLHSKDSRVIAFKEKIMKKYSGFTLQKIADNFGLAVALLHNCKHSVLANDPDLVKLLNPENVVQALQKWYALNQDDVLLNILKAFEEATGLK